MQRFAPPKLPYANCLTSSVQIPSSGHSSVAMEVIVCSRISAAGAHWISPSHKANDDFVGVLRHNKRMDRALPEECYWHCVRCSGNFVRAFAPCCRYELASFRLDVESTWRH